MSDIPVGDLEGEYAIRNEEKRIESIILRAVACTREETMTTEDQEYADSYMLGVYGVKPSIVTQRKWIETAPEVWVCAYSDLHTVTREGQAPRLYMAHCCRDADNKLIVIVYTIIDRIIK